MRRSAKEIQVGELQSCDNSTPSKQMRSYARMMDMRRQFREYTQAWLIAYCILLQQDLISCLQQVTNQDLCRASQLHLGAARRLLRYVKGTTSYGINFQPSSSADSQNDMWSTSCYTFTLGNGQIRDAKRYVWNEREGFQRRVLNYGLFSHLLLITRLLLIY